MTLVCHHPDLTSNPGRYFTTVPLWRENGVGIIPSVGTMFEANTAVEPTHTNLTITITVDHFRNKSFDYSCLLVLAENGLPTGEVETSENVTVDPIGELVYIASPNRYVPLQPIQFFGHLYFLPFIVYRLL